MINDNASKSRAPVSTPQQSAQRASVDTPELADLMLAWALSKAGDDAAQRYGEIIAHIKALVSARNGAPEVQEDIRIARHAVFNLKEFRAGRTTFPGEALGILEKVLDRLAAPSPAPQGEQAALNTQANV